MLRRTIEIINSSFKLAMQELWKNKLRTFLSMFGITIGIFCIIGVLTVVGSLEKNIQNEVQSLGSNTIYIDKWDYTAGSGVEYPWWKYVNRPLPKYDELRQIKERTSFAKYAAFRIRVNDQVEFNNTVLSKVNIYGITEDFSFIQPLEILHGRYLSNAEFYNGNNSIVVGHDVAEKLFGQVATATGKHLTLRGKKVLITGVIKKQGRQLIGGWDFDQSVILPYRFARSVMNERKADPLIMVQGRDGINSKSIKDELTGTMRGIHKLSPVKEEDFALNDVNDFSNTISSAFVSLNIGGWAIAALSLIVGMFGVANIMFVTVRERTGQIGLKKAVGAKNRVILVEFLLESAFLCIIGGLIGLILVFLLSQLLTAVLDFPVYISTTNMALAIVICIIVGIIAGYVPARQASKMNPVTAIRS